MPSGAVQYRTRVYHTSAVGYDAPHHGTVQHSTKPTGTMLPAIRCLPSESYMITIGIGIVLWGSTTGTGILFQERIYDEQTGGRTIRVRHKVRY